MNNDKDIIFKQQIEEDIRLIQENLSYDDNVKKDHYAFNCWVLSKIYSLDEEECLDNITEYNDKGIDCFVHYEEDRELYILQNKYYNLTNRLSIREVSDFLTRPISHLKEGKYKNRELQEIYNKAEQKGYTIYLHFYVSNNLRVPDVEVAVKNSNRDGVIANVFYLDDIREKYYGKSFKSTKELSVTMNLKNKGTCLAIRPKDYGLPNMLKSFYVMAKVFDVYDFWRKAKSNDYELFEENVRDYLGGLGKINKAIIATLSNPKERSNFFYYNNGITIICDSADADAKIVTMNNPQIVNGCQTVNSIAEALSQDDDPSGNFKEVYVMVKILVLDKITLNKKGEDFYRTIVKYSNSQNAINEKVFGATLQPFFTIQDSIKKQGFLLVVKQSDKNTFKDLYSDDKLKNKLLELANKNSMSDFHQFKRILDVQINLETLIQIIGAFKKDAHFAYVRKSSLLRPDSKEYYQKFSIHIADFFTVESMTKLIVLYKKSEYDKKASADKRSPSPYYLLNFLGQYLEGIGLDRQAFLSRISVGDLAIVYNRFKNLPSKYYDSYKGKHNLEYNQMIKREVDMDIVRKVLASHFSAMEEYNKDEYKELKNIFKDLGN